MYAIIDQSERMIRVNIKDVLLELLNKPDIKDYIIDANTERLKNRGVDIYGDKLRTYEAEGNNVYSHYTMNIRASEGRQYSHVDLYDTGAFYNSVKAMLRSGGLILTGKFDKSDGNIADNLDVSGVLGFTENNIEEIIKMIEQDIGETLLKKFGIL